MRIVTTTFELFADAMNWARDHSSRIAESTSEPLDSEGARFFALKDDDEWIVGGFCIRADGDLCLLWSTMKGQGDYLVTTAVENGAETLDCFDGYLPTLYLRHGFVAYARERNWTPGGPDVVFMAQSWRNPIILTTPGLETATS